MNWPIYIAYSIASALLALPVVVWLHGNKRKRPPRVVRVDTHHEVFCDREL